MLMFQHKGAEPPQAFVVIQSDRKFLLSIVHFRREVGLHFATSGSGAK
jgi:hypothetical protein